MEKDEVSLLRTCLDWYFRRNVDSCGNGDIFFFTHSTYLFHSLTSRPIRAHQIVLRIKPESYVLSGTALSLTDFGQTFIDVPVIIERRSSIQIWGRVALLIRIKIMLL
jgi:hypothetical protein